MLQFLRPVQRLSGLSHRMSSTTSPSLSPWSAAPFTAAVVRAARKLYPESLADKSFDNTGRKPPASHHPPIH